MIIQSGARITETGYYSYVRHTYDKPCEHPERGAPVSGRLMKRGTTAPRVPGCGHSCSWKLVGK